MERYRDNPFFLTFHAVTKLQLCYLFGDHGKALEAARTARAVVYHLSGTIWPVLFDFWHGLTLAANYAGAAEAERRTYLEELERAYQALAALAESCPENFLCQSLLLSAEFERISGRAMDALERYERSIAYAVETGMIQHQALANELYGRYWLERGQTRVAAVFLAEARDAYARWGATAKVSDLDRRYGSLHTQARTERLRLEPLGLPATGTAESTTRAEISSLDLITVMKAARALAGEIELERLLEKMMAIAIENAGAERGGLVLEHDGAPRVHAQGSGEHVTVQVHDAPPLTSTGSLPIVIVNHVRRTSESLVLLDARNDDRYRHDPYVLRQQPRSALAAPLINQGRLLGVIYLENNLATGVFTPERLALIQVLASQAAIAIQNAQLYLGLRREIADRTRMEEALRTITEETASLTGVQFFHAVARHAALLLHTKYGFVAEVVGDAGDRVSTLAYWQGEAFGDNVSFPLAGTPCEAVIAGDICFHPKDVAALFPEDRDLLTLGAEGYLGVPLRNSMGRVIGHIAVIHDRALSVEHQDLALLRIFATRAGTELERQRAEDALRESQLRYSTLAETVPEVLYTNSPDGSCDYVSQRFLDYTGMTSEAALGYGWAEALHPVDRDRAMTQWKESMQTGKDFNAEYRFRRADGEYRWFRARSIPMRDSEGTILKWFGVCSDVDDSKRGEQALRVALTEIAQLRDRLQAENVYLMEEVKQQQGFEEIIGRSSALAARAAPGGAGGADRHDGPDHR